MRILNIARKYKKYFFKDKKRGLLRIELNSKNLIHNVSQFRKKFPNQDLSVVLKSNAYGHGLSEIAGLLDKNKDIKYFVVDSLMEAVVLRDQGIKKPLIVLGYVLKEEIKSLKKLKDIVLMVHSLDQAKNLKSEVDFLLKIHLKVDTGMNRQGIPSEDFESVVEILKENENLKIEGLATHLADADNVSNFSTLVQLKKWKNILSKYKKIVSSKGIFHFSATAGSRYLKEAESNMIRIGRGLYGFDPVIDRTNPNSPDFMNLKPVLSFWAKVVNIKKLKKGESVGYGFTYKARTDKRIAIIPCGYYEGVPRFLSNKGSFYFKNQPLKILGRISMNVTIVDITNLKEDIHLEDEVEVISTNLDHLNSAEKYAKIGGTIVYDVLCRLSPNIKRKIC